MLLFDFDMIFTVFTYCYNVTMRFVIVLINEHDDVDDKTKRNVSGKKHEF